MTENRKKRLRTFVVVLALGLFGAGVVAARTIPRPGQGTPRASAAAPPGPAPVRVVVAHPAKPASDRALALPGSLEALRSTIIYARTDGYLKERLVDIGDRVKRDQLLAVIETPDVDQMLLQARATRLQALASLEQAKSARDLARISLERMKTLAPAGVAAQQDLDNAAASHAAAAANVRAAQAMIAENDANVRRLMEQKAFARVTAPFDGTITARMIEIGSLVMAGNGAGQELFKLDQSDPVRVLIAVPQGLSPLIHEGMSATVTVRQFPGRSFAGTVKRDARALDVVSRTLPTEVQVPNSDFTLLPGMYAVATLAFDSPRPWVLVDAAALELTADGPKLAVLGPDGLIHFHTVVIDVDYGAQLAISQGITVDDLVVLNPDGHLKEGTPAVAAN